MMGMDQTSKGITKVAEQPEQAERTDYLLKPEYLNNGDRRPTELFDYVERIKNWREKSSQSTTLVR